MNTITSIMRAALACVGTALVVPVALTALAGCGGPDESGGMAAEQDRYGRTPEDPCYGEWWACPYQCDGPFPHVLGPFEYELLDCEERDSGTAYATTCCEYGLGRYVVDCAGEVCCSARGGIAAGDCRIPSD